MDDDGEPELRPALEAMQPLGEAFSAAVGAFLERMWPAFEALGETLSRPEVRAAVERARSAPRPPPVLLLLRQAPPCRQGDL